MLKDFSIVLFNEHRLCYLCHQLTQAHTVRLHVVTAAAAAAYSLVQNSPHTDFTLSRATSLTHSSSSSSLSQMFTSFFLCISGLVQRNHHNTHSKIILNRCFAAVFFCSNSRHCFRRFENQRNNNNEEKEEKIRSVKTTKRNTVVVMCAVLNFSLFFCIFLLLCYTLTQLFN